MLKASDNLAEVTSQTQLLRAELDAAKNDLVSERKHSKSITESRQKLDAKQQTLDKQLSLAKEDNERMRNQDHSQVYTDAMEKIIVNFEEQATVKGGDQSTIVYCLLMVIASQSQKLHELENLLIQFNSVSSQHKHVTELMTNYYEGLCLIAN